MAFSLGYLLYNGHHNAAGSLFMESKELEELRSQYTKLAELPMNLTQITLIDLIKDYLQMTNFVAHHLSNTNMSCQLGSMASLLPQLLKNSTVGLNRTPPIRPIRPLWMPTGKAYLPPRVISTDHSNGISGIQVKQNPHLFRLPLVAVRPNSFTARKTGSVLRGMSSAISILPPGTTTRPLIRLVRNETPVFFNTASSKAEALDEPGTICRPVVCEKSTSTSPFHEDSSPSESPGPLEVVTVEDPCEESRDSVSEPDTHAPGDRLIESRKSKITVKPDLTQSASSTVEKKTGDRMDCASSPSTHQFPSGESELKSRNPPSGTIINTDSENNSKDTSPQVSSGGTKSITSSSVNTLPFTVFNHLPPASEAKRLSVGSDSSLREESLTPSSSSRRKRLQTPRHVVSGQTTMSVPLVGSESQDDVDIQRFLSALFSKPEQLATHINAKLNSLPSPTESTSRGICDGRTRTAGDLRAPVSEFVKSTTLGIASEKSSEIGSKQSDIVNPLLDLLEVRLCRKNACI
ncbi:unnamed protein product [Echinostoma caproni]|uniref:LisH domain-containing protein n=1 Tax=Echinostoma caproni TaxID=27848 RepID=A0A183B2A2_9TREM|nr:unnamed protein product [Echinostoma caproni]